MGGACSRKQEWDNEDSLIRGLPRRYCKCGSLKWWTSSFSYPSVDFHLRKGECPSLLDLCIQKINEVFFLTKKMLHLLCPYPFYFDLITAIFIQQDIDKYNTFSMLPRDISQLIFNNLVYSRRLTSASLEAFRDCALQVNHFKSITNLANCVLDIV